MSYEKSLRDSLKDKNEKLFNRLDPIEDEAKCILTYTAATFPSYTPHDFSHSLRVEENLNWIIPDQIKTSMNAHEIFLLLVSAWLHDWGMVSESGENPEEVRLLHHIRTETNFDTYYQRIHLSHIEAQIAGRICRGHRKEDLHTEKYVDSFLGSNVLIRVNFLAACLRMADELDITANRAPEFIYSSIKPEGKSKIEWQKHFAITGIGKPNPFKIEVSSEAKNPASVELLESIEKQLQSQLNSVKTILSSNGIELDIVKVNVVPKGFINKPISFNLDKKNIINLLIGTALYDSNDVAIRELLQNALDTCHLKKIIDSTYSPVIIIEIDGDSISFEDNGIGMNFEDSLDFFSKKGNSFYVSKDLDLVLDGKDFDPISKFGIGVLSAFMISEKMLVETKKDNCNSCRFTISDISQGWTYQEGSRKNVGTKITLFLNSAGKQIDPTKSLEHYAKILDVPICIKNKSTGEIKQFISSWTYNMQEAKEAQAMDYLGNNNIEKPTLTLRKVTDDADIIFYYFKNAYFKSENCFLCHHGIYVNNFSIFLNENGHWILLINCKTDTIDLSVSRSDIIKNGKYEVFMTRIYSYFIDMIKDSFKKLDDPDKTIATSKCFRSLFYDGFGNPRNLPKSNWISIFCDRKVYPVFTKGEQVFLTGKEIVERKFSKVYHYSTGNSSAKEHLTLIDNYYKNVIKCDEAIVVDFGPEFPYITYNPRKFNCSFCEILILSGIGQVDCIDLQTVLGEINFTKEITPLDSLLSNGSFFAHLPEFLRSATIEKKRFKFESNFQLTVPSKSIYSSEYANLVGRTLFEDEKNFFDLFSSKLWYAQRAKLISAGLFVYDIDDPILSFLLSKADKICADPSLKKIVSRYLKLLAISFLNFVNEGQKRGNYESLLYLEKTLAELLNYDRVYEPLERRAIKLFHYISKQ